MKPICECCNKNESVRVASLPFAPMSIAWCQQCIDVGVYPYNFLVTEIMCLGGRTPDIICQELVDAIDRSLKYFEKTYEELDADVKKANDEFNKWCDEQAAQENNHAK